MIVNYNSLGWQIITQRAHGLLAGQICARWKLSNQPEYWFDTLVATTEHDDVYNEFEKKPLIDDNGAPINFKETSFDLQACQRQIDMALTKSRFITLLVSRHIDFTHGENPLAGDFITTLKNKEKKWVKEADVTRGDLDRTYELLEFCDAFSLLICQGQVPPSIGFWKLVKDPMERPITCMRNRVQLLLTPGPSRQMILCSLMK